MDPNQLCSDPDLASKFSCPFRFGSGSGSEKDPNTFGSCSNSSNYFKIKAFTFVKILFLRLMFPFPLAFKSVYM